MTHTHPTHHDKPAIDEHRLDAHVRHAEYIATGMHQVQIEFATRASSKVLVHSSDTDGHQVMTRRRQRAQLTKLYTKFQNSVAAMVGRDPYVLSFDESSSDVLDGGTYVLVINVRTAAIDTSCTIEVACREDAFTSVAIALVIIRVMKLLRRARCMALMSDNAAVATKASRIVSGSSTMDEHNLTPAERTALEPHSEFLHEISTIGIRVLTCSMHGVNLLMGCILASLRRADRAVRYVSNTNHGEKRVLSQYVARYSARPRCSRAQTRSLAVNLRTWNTAEARENTLAACKRDGISCRRQWWQSSKAQKQYGRAFARMACDLCVLPVSSCDVERCFSIFTRMKRDRARMASMNVLTARTELMVRVNRPLIEEIKRSAFPYRRHRQSAQIPWLG